MAIFASIFGIIGQQGGRILSTALGWASTLLFGRVPKQRELLLSVITLGSLLWVALIAGVIVPSVGTFLLAAVPAPEFIQENWIRLAMLVGALILPLLIGVGGLFIMDAADRPKGLGLIKQILRGYPLAFLLAFMLAFLAVVGIARKARSVAKGWSDAHIPIVVRPGGYETMVTDLEDALDQAGLDVARRPAPGILALPARLVATVAGGGVRSLVPDKLTMLASRTLEVGLYPSDISIAGPKKELARARAAIASRLTSTAAHLTTSRESQAVEDRLEALTRHDPVADGAGRVVLPAAVAAELHAIDELLARLDVDYDEWEVLYRMRLQVERDLLAGERVGEAFPGAQRGGTASAEREASPPQPAWLAPALATAGVGLVALDVGLALLERVRPPSR